MYAKHFLKMLLGLLVMAILGVAGLVLVNYYSKTGETPQEAIKSIGTIPTVAGGTISTKEKAPPVTHAPIKTR
jgi:ABC-type proline/glycine betaine transport system permease subunit